MGSSFKFDTRALERQAKEAAEKEARTRAARKAQAAQRVFDRLVADHRGEPVDELIPLVQAAFREATLEPDNDGEVREYAELVSAGERIVFKPQITVRWR